MTGPSSRFQHPAWKWSIALLSVLLVVGVSETLLRWALFDSSLDLGAKEPTYYARTADEVWIYRHLFSNQKEWSVAPGRSVAYRETAIPFYRAWPTSLVPDGELGYVRRTNVRVPCHETTNLATRGTRDYALAGPKIVFLGDSFVESAACSNDTLTTKLEALTGVDVLNHGVGGYGLDQMYLSFLRVVPLLDRDDVVYLVGLIQDDVDRVLLKGRTAPKPYFTADGARLVLHTDHIHPASLNDYFERPPGHFYLYELLRGRLGHAPLPAALRQDAGARRDRVLATAALIFDAFAERRRSGRFRLAFVILPSPGPSFDPAITALLRARDLPVVDLQGCLRASGLPDSDLYAELHPTSVGNDLLARCLAADLRATGSIR